MSEFQTVKATPVSVQTAVAAKPRISADAFRNLTARLKKAEVDVPSLTPVAIVQPTLENTVSVAPVLQPVASHIVISPIAPQTVEAVPAQIPETIAVDPVFEPMIVPSAIMPVTPIVAVEQVIAPVLEPILEDTIVPIAPIAPIEIAFAPEPMLEVANIQVETPVVVEPAQQIFPLLPEYVPPTAASTAIEPIAAIEEPQVVALEIDAVTATSFQENFTYVPEPGKPDAPVAAVSPADIGSDDEALKLELAQRAVELELENIWRLMLAKPTSDDRINYLREAAEIHSADDEWNKPDAEHDLSNIAPAPLAEDAHSESAIEATLQVEPTIRAVDLLPIAEGQDLAELTRSLLDMMAAGNASGLPQERALAADTLLRLVPRLELKPLVMLAQRLAMMDNPPNLLVSRLIRDPRVEVAGPLLEDCSHIADKDLEQIIQEGEPDKLRMIGRRRRLNRSISDALIRSGDPSVVLTLVRNSEAEISHDGFQSLLSLAEHHEEILAPLATRQDFGAPFAFELFWLAPPQLRRFIFSRFLTDSETLTKILKITKMANTEDESEAEPMSQFTLLEALERAARGHIEVAAEELSSVMQLSTATITRILSDLQGDAIVVMLKAAAYPRSAMAGLLKRLQDADLPLISRERDLNELHSMFETLSFNKARILLTYWDWAQSKTGPYAPVH